MENSAKEKKANDTDGDLAKGRQPTVQSKPDKVRVTTVTPDNDSGEPGPSGEKPAGKR